MQKRYWLRGLVTVGLVGFLFALNIVGTTQCVWGTNCDIFNRLWIGIRWFPIYLMSDSVNTVYLIAFYVLVPGLIGAILGWLYGKIVKNP